MKKRKLVFFGLGGAIVISILGVSHAQASSIPFIFNTINQLKQELQSIDNYVESVLESKLEPLASSLGKDIEVAINETLGVLGLPDAIEARTEVEKIAASSDNAINTVEQVTNEVDRQITRAVVDSTLSKNGQNLTSEEVKKTQNSIERVQVYSAAAQDEVVTQNVMKRIAQQNTSTAAILGAMRADGLKSKQSQDLANLNLTNISRSLDGQNQMRNKEIVGQGFSNLRTAAQAKLF
ncbi:hypothetical protein Riv7116_4883 [Rivularia sp. PCC 7116]|uniref:hypothetical protein n=1 Tax=Rivularia sp. PCC 7116 TaxID=373994 RepID=UPI00029EDBE6|nr:hypothetical protein [Rivularia sp. PCC 7116]AFY57293.1 hypothetical protein Riv7116_4883 [Rivularia sp. PCC 7116]